VLTCETGADTVAARLPGRHHFAEGAPVSIGWDDSQVHLFDAATGTRRDDIRFTAEPPQRRTA
jgi:hypothetical protein